MEKLLGNSGASGATLQANIASVGSPLAPESHSVSPLAPGPSVSTKAPELLSPELAGSASLRSNPSPLPLSPVSLVADALWCADTGATAHMTPHRHWMRTYRPYRVPGRLADSTIVYSAGIGSVVFVPEVGGKRGHSVEFSEVLHVPDLRSNLLSVLFLTRNKSFSVVILESVMHFIHHRTIVFTARVQASNCAYLEGSTTPVSTPVLRAPVLAPISTLSQQPLCRLLSRPLWPLSQPLL